MASGSGGGDDPARTLRLLWRATAEPTRGPQPGLSVDQVVAAAVAVADADGLGAVSMRRVAQRLGVGTMTLYTYVPGKAELVALMQDAVYAEVAAPAAGEDWRERLRRVAWNNWELYHRHPWLLEAVTARPLLGPNETAKYDAELRALDGVGLTDVEMDAVLGVVLAHVRECARAAVEQARLAERTGWDEARWWQVHGPLLARHLDADRYPVAARVGRAAGAVHRAAFPPRYTFEFGLARLCDGVEALLRRRRDG
jgi:AcrR family transcriptional regulator